MHQPKTLLVTGGAGFIGCNYVRESLAAYPEIKISVLDALTYAGSLDNLSGLAEAYPRRYEFIKGDIRDCSGLQEIFSSVNPDTIVHFAAESHVDRSIDGPLAFVDTNIAGTANLLTAAVKLWGKRTDVRFHHVSTDEVYGSLGDDGFFTEDTPYDPSSPYSASKAASDHLARAWGKTFCLPVTISNCSNNYGPYQFPEKLIPLMISAALTGKALPIYGEGKNIRDWLHVSDHCQAINLIIRQGQPGRTYNVGGLNEWTNLQLVHKLCAILDEIKPKASGSYREQINFVKDRPAHDLRYAIDASRIREELGFTPRWDFADGLKNTVEWYLNNQDWVKKIQEKKYAGERLGATSFKLQ